MSKWYAQRTAVLTLVVGLLIPCAVHAQTPAEPNTNLVQNRHGLEISAGLLSQMHTRTTITLGSLETHTGGSGFIGALTYLYRFDPQFAFTVSAGLHGIKVDQSIQSVNVSTETSSIYHLLFGIRYYPRLFDGSFRPFLAGAAGAYVGMWNQHTQSSQPGVSSTFELTTESAVGARLGLGADILLSRHLKLGVGTGYHFVSDFTNPIGSQENVSGPDFVFSFGVIL